MLDLVFSQEKYEIIDDIELKKRILPPIAGELHCIPVLSARRLTFSADVDTVIELTLDNEATSFDFKPGDTIGILPENDLNEVEYLLHRLDALSICDRKYELVTKATNVPKHLPVTGTLRYVLRHLIDIRRVLSKQILQKLCSFTTNETERNDLERLYTDRKLYLDEILNKGIGIVKILRLYPSCRPSVSFLVENLPQLASRPYTIFNVHQDVLKICFSVVRNENGTNGLTTGMLEKLLKFSDSDDIDRIADGLRDLELDSNPPNVFGFFKKSAFHLCADNSAPIIMICNGTGVAPFIGFLEQRQAARKSGEHVGFSALYFGCRYSDKDQLYGDRIDEFIRDGTLSKFVAGYSRQCGQYVQDVLDLDRLDDNSIIYVCGSNKMAKAVEAYFIKLVRNLNNITEIDAKAMVKDMKKNGSYVQDIWL